MTGTIIPGPFETDESFDSLFPVHIRQLSKLHWSPLQAVRIASAFLAPCAEASVIDIGAGVGKFIIAASHFTQGHFTGIEYQKNLVVAGKKVISGLNATRAQLLHTGFKGFDISPYSGIYFYNSFYENLIADEALQEANGNGQQYENYMALFREKLTAMPPGTRLATYWLDSPEVPGCYTLQESHLAARLKLWIKAN